MKFRALQENLRKTLWSRIEEGDLTGLHLAAQTGFKQAHISNFLNRKRGLSLEGMDKVLNVQHLSVLDLLDPAEINKRASILPPSGDEFENVLVVNGATAAKQALVMSMNVKEMMKFKKSFLRKLRAETEGDRDEWERFVVIKVDGREGMSMYPRLLPGATVLIDRHYNSLKPYRKGESNMYAVSKNGGCTGQTPGSASPQSRLSGGGHAHGRRQIGRRLSHRTHLLRGNRNLERAPNLDSDPKI